MKTTKKQYDTFKKSFVKWQKKLGLLDWKIYFRRKDIGNNYARIHCSITGRVATVIMCNKITGKDEIKDFNAEETGKHEAIHLLLAVLNYHAHARYLHEEDIDAAEEAVVRTLEKVLGG